MRTIVAALIAAAAMAVPASAAEPVFGPVQDVGGAPGLPQVSMGPAGDARVAWAAKDGIWAAMRPGPALPFGAAQPVAAGEGYEVSLARNLLGGAAIAYMAGQVPRVALAAPLQPFGAPEDVPVPARAPTKPGNENIIEDSRNLWGIKVAHSLDGRTAVVYHDTDYRADVHRAVAVVRGIDGRWSAPQLLGTNIVNASIAASGARLVVMWTEHDPGQPANAPRRVWVADAGPDGTFGAPQAVSPQGVDADNNFGGLGLVASNRGDLLVHYNGGEPGHPIPNGAGVIERPLGGVWGGAVTVSAGMRPTGAVGDRGDAILVWSTGMGLGASYRPPLGSWGPPETAELPPGSVEGAPVAIDSTGTAIALRRLDSAKRLVALLRPTNGRFGAPVDVTPPGTIVNWPSIATDPYGNGVIAWATPKSNFVRTYSAHPPEIGRPVVSPYVVTVPLDEPARLEIGIARDTRRARSSARPVVFRAVGRATRNRVALPARARALLARGGRFRLTVRAHDGGPRAGKRTVRFRRR